MVGGECLAKRVLEGSFTMHWPPASAAQEITIPMVNPGGESTMLGHWRIVLRQAEEAARAGRFEEAFALASRPDVTDHHHSVQFRGRLALDLIARATRRGAVDDLAGADRRPEPGRADRGSS